MKNSSNGYHRRLEEIFHAALSVNASARDALLDKLCSDNPQLRREVRQLIENRSSSHRQPLDPQLPSFAIREPSDDTCPTRRWQPSDDDHAFVSAPTPAAPSPLGEGSSGSHINADDDISAASDAGADINAKIHDGLKIAQYELIRPLGREWTSEQTGATAVIRDMWGSDENNIFVVGAEGIFHFDGTSWTPANTPKLLTEFRSIWGVAPDAVFAGGSNGTLAFYDGERWSPVRTPTQADINAVWASDWPGELFIGTEHGEIYTTTQFASQRQATDE